MGACSSLTCKTGSPNVSPASSHNPLPFPPNKKNQPAKPVKTNCKSTQKIDQQNPVPIRQEATCNKTEPQENRETIQTTGLVSGPITSLENLAKSEAFLCSSEGRGQTGLHIEVTNKVEIEEEEDLTLTVIEDSDTESVAVEKALHALDSVLQRDSADDLTDTELIDIAESFEEEEEEIAENPPVNETDTAVVERLAKELVNKVIQRASADFVKAMASSAKDVPATQDTAPMTAPAPPPVQAMEQEAVTALADTAKPVAPKSNETPGPSLTAPLEPTTAPAAPVSTAEEALVTQATEQTPAPAAPAPLIEAPPTPILAVPMVPVQASEALQPSLESTHHPTIPAPSTEATPASATPALSTESMPVSATPAHPTEATPPSSSTAATSVSAAPPTEPVPASATSAPSTEATPASTTPAPLTDALSVSATPASPTEATPASATPAPSTEATSASTIPTPSTEATPASGTPSSTFSAPSTEATSASATPASSEVTQASIAPVPSIEATPASASPAQSNEANISSTDATQASAEPAVVIEQASAVTEQTAVVPEVAQAPPHFQPAVSGEASPEDISASAEKEKVESAKAVEAAAPPAPIDLAKLRQHNLLLKLQKELAIMTVRMSQLQDCMRATQSALSTCMDFNMELMKDE